MAPEFSGNFFGNIEYEPYDATEKPIEVYIKGVSGLRTLGIFGVILYHMYPYNIQGGFLGVTLFFIISGYLLAVKSEESRRIHTFNVGSFYLKRIKRLYPQLVIVLAMTCASLKYFFPSALIGIRKELVSILLGYNNIWQIMQNTSYFERIANSSPFTHMWSLANELQLYLIWPLIFWIFNQATKSFGTKKAINIIGVMALATSIIMPIMYRPDMDVTRIYYGTDTRIFSFITGAYIGFRRTRYRRSVRIKDPKKPCFAFAGLCVLLIISYIFMTGEGAFTYLGGMFLINILIAFMLMLVTDSRLPIGDFLEKKAIKFFGDISYEMYLWMYPVIYIFHSKGWNKVFGSGLLAIVIIVVLAKWLNEFAKTLIKRKFDFSGNIGIKLLKSLTVALSIVFIGVFCYGGYCIASAPSDNKDEIELMQAEFENNAKKLQEEKTVSESVVTESDSSSKKSQETEKIKETKEPEEEEGRKTIAPEDRVITAVGDSVMLGASVKLMEKMPGSTVDAAESRQVVKVLEILKELEANGKLGNTVILAVGTNGPFKEATGQEIIDFLGTDRDIFWVNVCAPSNVVAWVDQSNDMIKKLADRNDNLTVIDWEAEGSAHPEWFYTDHIHLREDATGQGQSGYADYISSIVMAK